MIEYFVAFGIGGICGTAISLYDNYLRKQREIGFTKDLQGDIQRLEGGLVYQSNRDLIKKLGGKND